jgi:hypothetical protein
MFFKLVKGKSRKPEVGSQKSEEKNNPDTSDPGLRSSDLRYNILSTKH